MPILHLVVATTIALFAPQDCTEWHACRDLAVAAASSGDYEAFHDLAWRTVQTGPKNDPALMLLLARAQALSGRPGDALVMLARLTDRGVATNAATSPDFRRVRALAGWPDLERRMAAMAAGTGPAAPAPPVPTMTASPATAPVPAAPPVPITPPVPAAPPVLETPPPGRGGDEVPAAPGAAPARAPSEPAEALRFANVGLTPDGLAYDGVSRRFLIADRYARKLAVVDEFSQHVATLAGAQAAFGDIEAMEIDSHAGDLWVVSSEPAAAGGATTLHKLQLVSGRVLSTFTVPPPLAPAHFIDVAVASGGTVLVLDARGRIFRLKGGALELAAVVPPDATSLAPTDNGGVYVATSEGLVHVDMATRTAIPVIPSDGASLSGLSHLRWYRGTLVAVQRIDMGARVVRLRLGRGGRIVTALESIDTIEAPTGAITIAGGTLYYFASAGGGEVVLKRVPL